ncbi:hypothetical protein HYPSUDRAFT_151345 [Hypholoma sublateritium FD-334 SS-4]|uniref:Peptide hydrolase n=1 Tax=Hypholoma sublateritium (strain FD-334 SS-4) TaxID=945553 RepID=A0A0D2KGN2_HYPSF|nr:hypothetical protein HYPSUDRAFT_151345 [Hypholoma sublateritium FD-334 SS-4]
MSATALPTLPLTIAQVRAKAALGFNLLRLAEDADPVWVSNEEKDALIAKRIRFFDITDVYEPEDAPGFAAMTASTLAAAVTYTAPSHQAELAPIIATVSLPSMKNYLNNLTAFNNRYYLAATGLAASVYIRDTISNITAKYPTSGASVALFPHTWLQSSIVAKIPGTNASGPVTILGAHMDSVGSGTASTARAPGADDDASGASNLMEAFRVLVASGFKPQNPVEFQWYSGEEGGLKGSQAIAKSYKSANKQVKAMLQFDMTAYVKPGTTPVVGLMPDYVDAGLTSFVGSLVLAYTNLKWVTSTACGYGCSDHASWNAQGYPSALPFESKFTDINPNIHTSADTTSVNGFSWEHSLEFAKLAVGFAYELAI